LPLQVGSATELVVAPHSVRQFMSLLSLHPQERFRLTSSARLERFILTHGGEALGRRAAFAFDAAQPHLSAAGHSTRLRAALAIIIAAVIAAFAAFSDAAMQVIATGLSLSFLSWLGLRNFCSFLEVPRPRPVAISDRDLPTYTVIAALYREAEAVEGLVAALRQLDYPPEKLDIKLVIEADDDDTRRALAGLGLAPPFSVMIAPDIGPRTKPKALNAAFLFARGAFTVIYDAEDRPERDQLRRAVEMFRAENDDVACVQARLTIDNTDDSWLSRLFTAEYGAQFDLFLPGLARLRAPLPLGGSSNHFRTDVLHAVGAWDPFNVTEDADLGMRLARYGYRSTVIESETYEEAPARFGPWLHQRTRWFKGWAQTWAVHMRTPLHLLRELGPGGFLIFQLVVGGNILAALIHPIFLLLFVHAVVSSRPFASMDGVQIAMAILYGMTLSAGYFTSVFLGIRALARHRLMRAAGSLALVPVHWLILSLAAWRALIQLMRNPHGWEKTEHGLARSSRRAKKLSTATLDAIFRPQRLDGADARRLPARRRPHRPAYGPMNAERAPKPRFMRPRSRPARNG
jgi:cellulose synthase/poly-beta-1,6-N-acetylglucosamine synthase-like glycosyltransferase